jgi:hypothetical protein
MRSSFRLPTAVKARQPYVRLAYTNHESICWHYREQVEELVSTFNKIDTSTQVISVTQDFISRQKRLGLIGSRASQQFLYDFDSLLTAFPAHYAGAQQLKELVKTLLEHQVEYFWYRDFPAYTNDLDVNTDPDLYDLYSRRHQYQLLFRFSVLREEPWHKLLNPVRRKLKNWLNHPARGTVGMRTTRCKPVMIALLNEISTQLTSQLDVPVKLQVNSLLRTVSHQRHLASLGYWAPSVSSHTIGYAADIERNWYVQNHPQLFTALQTVLEGYYRKRVINLIDEGRVWHICLHPSQIDGYGQKLSLWQLS